MRTASGSIRCVIWVIVVGVLALIGVVGLIIGGVSLIHKTADVRAEIGQLNGHVAHMRDMLGQLEKTSRLPD